MKEAVKEMKKGRAAGPTGLTVHPIKRSRTEGYDKSANNVLKERCKMTGQEVTLYPFSKES